MPRAKKVVVCAECGKIGTDMERDGKRYHASCLKPEQPEEVKPSLKDALEPAAMTFPKPRRWKHFAVIGIISAAVSLKRIADAADRLQGGDGPAWLNGLESLAWSCGQSFERGRGAS